MTKNGYSELQNIKRSKDAGHKGWYVVIERSYKGKRYSIVMKYFSDRKNIFINGSLEEAKLYRNKMRLKYPIGCFGNIRKTTRRHSIEFRKWAKATRHKSIDENGRKILTYTKVVI